MAFFFTKKTLVCVFSCCFFFGKDSPVNRREGDVLFPPFSFCCVNVVQVELWFVCTSAQKNNSILFSSQSL